MELVAGALNKGELARAMMTAVLMRLPEPGDPVCMAELDGVLAKAGFNPDEPRDEQGQWTNGGDSATDDTNVPDRSPRIQLAEADGSDASNDPVAQAAARAAARQDHKGKAPHASSWITRYPSL